MAAQGEIKSSDAMTATGQVTRGGSDVTGPGILVGVRAGCITLTVRDGSATGEILYAHPNTGNRQGISENLTGAHARKFDDGLWISAISGGGVTAVLEFTGSAVD